MVEERCVEVVSRPKIVTQAYERLDGDKETVSEHSYSTATSTMLSPCDRTTEQLAGFSAQFNKSAGKGPT